MVTAVGARHGDIELQPFQLSIAGCPVLVGDWFAWGFMMQHPLLPRPWFLGREEMDKAFDWWASIFSSWASERPRHREKCFESIIGSLKLKFRRVGRSSGIRRASNHMTARLSRLIEWLGRANYWGKIEAEELIMIHRSRPAGDLFSLPVLDNLPSYGKRHADENNWTIWLFFSVVKDDDGKDKKLQTSFCAVARAIKSQNATLLRSSSSLLRFWSVQFWSWNFTSGNASTAPHRIRPRRDLLSFYWLEETARAFVSVFIHESFYEWRWTRERARNGSTDGEWKLRWFAWWKTNGW